MEKDFFDKKTISRLRTFIYFATKNEEEAEEILQETLISAYESLPRFGGRSTFYSWLCGIAKHETADFYRKKKIKTILFSHLPFLEKLADQAMGPEERAIEEELKRKMTKVFKGLTEGYRVVLRLKYIDGDSVTRIAQKLGLSVKAVESRLTRARLAFREAWLMESSEFRIQNAELRDKNKKDSSF
ncbi:MAG: RNA polymerase sigma factor [bacterium]|nr:RNA polymerase sigma factor [bacterium]